MYGSFSCTKIGFNSSVIAWKNPHVKSLGLPESFSGFEKDCKYFRALHAPHFISGELW